MATIVVADVESYYDQEYSLRKMGVEEYILSSEWETHGWAISIDQAPSEFFTHPQATRIFAGIDWPNAILLGHNLMFDAAVLCWKYGHIAGMYADTLGIANCFIRPYTGRVDLDTCSRHLGLPLKGSVIKEVKGKHINEIISAGLWDRLSSYANQDAMNCLAIFLKFYPLMNRDERLKLDWTTRNYIHGRLRLDMKKLNDTLSAKIGERNALLQEAGLDNPKYLRSTAEFAKHLEWLGVEVEYKNGKNDAEIPAVGKDDFFMRDLLAHEDIRVRNAAQARLAFSSSLDVTRCNRLLRMGRATGGKMLMPMRYHAAHTGRPGGADGVNFTNFKRARPGVPSPLREAITAPQGMALVNVDASQIEARICARNNRCFRLVAAFADPERDPYCEYASSIFGRTITKKDIMERQVGKVGILSLQYGCGAQKTYNTLQAQGIPVTLAECQSYVDIYRMNYPEMLATGQEFVNVLQWCIQTGKTAVNTGITFAPDRLTLPTGRSILYPNAKIVGRTVEYWSPKYKSWQKLYHGAINENISQAEANDIVGAVHVKFRKDTVSMVYDSIVRLVPAREAERVGEETAAEMRKSPWWAKDLVVDAEYKVSTHL